MKIFETFSDFSGFDCNMVFHTGSMNPSDLSHFGPNLIEFGWKYTLWKAEVQNRTGTPSFKVS